MPNPLIIFPFGGNARDAAGMILSDPVLKKEWDILGFIDDDPAFLGKDAAGVRVLGGREQLSRHPSAFVLAAPGNPRNYRKRAQMVEDLKLNPSRFVQLKHSSVVVSPDAKIGYNTLIMPNVVIGSGVTVGNHSIILSNTVIAHNSSIGEHCCIGSGVIISGYITIEASCYIASGASIRDHLVIGAGSLVGIGSNVIADVEAGAVAAGNPAKILRKIEEERTSGT